MTVDKLRSRIILYHGFLGAGALYRSSSGEKDWLYFGSDATIENHAMQALRALWPSDTKELFVGILGPVASQIGWRACMLLQQALALSFGHTALFPQVTSVLWDPFEVLAAHKSDSHLCLPGRDGKMHFKQSDGLIAPCSECVNTPWTMSDFLEAGDRLFLSQAAAV